MFKDSVNNVRVIFFRVIAGGVFSLLSLFSFQIAFATLYTPGETLEPDCGPTDLNCGVSPVGDANTGVGAPALVSPNTGALYFDTAGGIFYAYDGATWIDIGSGTSITSLNGMTGASQTFALGTSGTDVSWSSAADVHTLNIPSASALNRGLVTIGSQTFAGDKTFGDGLAINGNFATPQGTNYPTTGTQNDVDLGEGSFFRYTGVSDATFTGIAGGTDGRIIRIVNTTANVLTLSDHSSVAALDSSAANRIDSANQEDIIVAAEAMVSLQYDAGTSIWRVLALPVSTVHILQDGNNFGEAVSIGSTDAFGLNLLTSGVSRFAVAAGASTLTGTGSTTITSTGGLTFSSAAASAISMTTGTTGGLTIDSGTTGAINFGTGSNSKAITIGNTTGTTALTLNSGSGGISLGGNTTITGSNTFTTGTGTTRINSTTVNLAGNSTVLDMSGTGTLSLNTTNNAPITTGTGLLTVGGSTVINGGLTVSGNMVTPKGADYTVSGSANDVVLGTGALHRYTGVPPATITGIADGVDGQILTFMNSANGGMVTFTNDDASSVADNRIITGTGGSIELGPDTALMLQYEDYGDGEKHWQVLAPPSSVATVIDAFLQGGNSFGAVQVLGPDDFFGLNLQTNGVTALALDTSGNGTLTGDFTVTGGDISSPAATAFNVKTGTTGILTLDSGSTGAINLGTGANSKTITIGNTTGTTGVTINTGSSGISLAGNTSITGSNNLTVGTGTFSQAGNYATPRGSDYSTTGVQNNVNLGTGSLFGYTGSGTATFSGLAGGTDGRLIRIVNASAFTLSFTNEDSGSTDTNRILTTAVGGTLTIPAGVTATFQYDSTAARWRLTVLPAASGTISGFVYINGGNAFTADADLGTTDAFALNLITNNSTALSLDTSGNGTLTGDLTVTGGDVLSAAGAALRVTAGTTGALTLDSGTTGAVNLGTGANAKTVTVGNTTTTSTLALQSGTGGISLQVAGTGAIGNVQIGAGSGSATPDLLVLDLKNNDGTDPAGGVNGASYYNTTSNKFRCYEGGGWKDCDTTGGTTTLQTAYNAGAGITTASSTDLALTLTSGNFTATGTGAVLLTPTAASSFTSGGALTFTGGAASTWGTSSGNLTLQVAGTGVTANVQIGAGGAGSATPDLFLVDTKSLASGASDPAGSKGAIYYNIASEKFRCYESAAWKDCDTTVGSGLGTLNGQTGASQTLVVGTSGTDFNIVSGSDVHTFNIPDASATNRGLVTTGTQTLAGTKTFSGDLLVNGNSTLGNATGDSLTVNGSTVTIAGNSTVFDMTGTGTLSLNTVTNRAITTGTGLFTAGGSATVTGDLTYSGSLISPRGSDFSLVGSQNNVNFGAGTWFRFTGASQITITGIANPSNGRQIRLTNASSSNMVFSNQDVASTDVNRIITTTGGNLTIPPDVTATFQYDSTTTRWRLVVLPASSGSVSTFAYVDGGNAFGATASLGTTDANILNLLTNNATALSLDTSGNGTLTGDLTVTGGDIVTPAATALNLTAGTTGVLTLDSGSTGAINLGTGANSKVITFGNSTGTTAVNIISGSGNLDVFAGTSTFQTNTATDDTLILTPKTGGGVSFGGILTSADLTVGAKTWTFPNLTGGVLLDTSTCPVAGSFACNGGNGFAAALSIGTTDANALNLTTGGATRFAIASGASTMTGTGTTTLTSTGSMALSSATASNLNITTGTTGILTLDSGTTGAVNLGSGANSKTVTIGNTTGTTTLNLNSGSGGVAIGGSTTISGSNSFTTGTGTTTVNSTVITLAGASAVMDLTSGTLGINTTSNQAVTFGSGLTTMNGALSVTGAVTFADGFSTPKGSDFATTGTSNDVNFGAGSLFRYTGVSTATITGIAGGTDGRFIRIMNVSSSNLTFSNQDVLSTTATDRIITSTGGNLVIPPDVAVGFQYDSGVSRWRTVVLPATSGTLASSVFLQGGNGFGAAGNLGTTDANILNLITGGATRFSIAAAAPTLTGTGTTSLTSTGTMSLSSAAASNLTVDSGTTGSVLIGTGVAAKTITIGNSTDDAFSLNSSGLVVSTGGALTGVASVDTIAHSATAITFAGAGTVSSTTSSSMSLDSGTTGSILIGTGVAAKTITIGNGADDTFSLNSSALVVSTTGALTGVSSIDTIASSATAFTFAGAGTVSSTTSSAMTVDSGTTGAVNIGTGASAKTITIGNTTSTSTLNLQSGTGGILMTVDSTASSGMVRIGNSATATPDLLVLDNGTADPAGVTGGMYYNTGTAKFRCYENGAWANCIGGGSTGADIQHAASYDTSEALTNIPTGGAQVTLGTVSVTPSTATGDVYVTGWALVVSGNNTDQPLQLVIETTSNCTGTTVGNASVTYTITTAAAAGYPVGEIRVSGIAVDAGASAQPYSLCAAVTSGGGDSDVFNWGIEALVIDSGADLAEIYTTNDFNLEAGDVVALDPSLQTGVRKSSGVDDMGVVGIVSTRPGSVIGGVSREGVQALPIALAGRVPVKVSNENGAIAIGDYLSPSSTPGVAMKSGGTGVVVGQAMSARDGDGVGVVLAFVKNFALSNQPAVLGDVSPREISGDGLSTILAVVQSEAAQNPIAIAEAKVANGQQFLTDFLAVRVTAIRGYFDELFAKKIHTEQLCVKKSDGTEVCVDGDQLQNVMNGEVISEGGVINPATTPAPVIDASSVPSFSPTLEDNLPLDVIVEDNILQVEVPADVLLEPGTDPAVTEPAVELSELVVAPSEPTEPVIADVSVADEVTIVEPVVEPMVEVAPTPVIDSSAPASSDTVVVE